MVCSEFSKLLDNYENLTESEIIVLNNHSAECKACQSELEFFKSITNAVSALPYSEPPADLIEKVNKQLDSMPSGRFNIIVNNIRHNAYRYASVAACLAVGLVVGLNNKTINEHLKDRKTDGVINTTTVTETASEEPKPKHDEIVSEEARDLTPAQTKATDTVTAAPVTETKKKSSSDSVKKTKTVEQTQRNSNTKQSKTTTTVSKTIKATQSPTQAPTQSPEVQSIKTETPVQEIVTSKPDASLDSGENTEKSTYTISKDVYYIPESEGLSATAEPVKDVKVESYSLASEEGQIAIGYYDVPEKSKRSIKTDSFTETLTVSVNDVGTITTHMSELGAMNSGRGYQMSSNDFYILLARLDRYGISYRYSSSTPPGDNIVFNIVTY